VANHNSFFSKKYSFLGTIWSKFLLKNTFLNGYESVLMRPQDLRSRARTLTCPRARTTTDLTSFIFINFCGSIFQVHLSIRLPPFLKIFLFVYVFSAIKLYELYMVLLLHSL